jgi:hypothetical protein
LKTRSELSRSIICADCVQIGGWNSGPTHAEGLEKNLQWQ